MTRLVLTATGVVFAGILYLVWTVLWSGPALTVVEGGRGTVLANLFLGEYWMEFKAITIRDQRADRVVLSARPVADTKHPTEVPLVIGADLREPLEEAGWVIDAPETGAVTLSRGEYGIVARGNNGFGHMNLARCTLRVDAAPALRCGLFR